MVTSRNSQGIEKMKCICIKKNDKDRDKIISNLIRSKYGFTAIKKMNGDDVFIIEQEEEEEEEKKK